MNTTCTGLTEQTIENVTGVLARHPKVESAILYGSRAKGNFKNGSDIDLTLVGAELAYRDLLAITGELDELLLPYTIDLSIFHQLEHQALIDHIQRVGIPIYKAESHAETRRTGSKKP
jgi:predicted nucleotidyltransferase